MSELNSNVVNQLIGLLDCSSIRGYENVSTSHVTELLILQRTSQWFPNASSARFFFCSTLAGELLLLNQLQNIFIVQTFEGKKRLEESWMDEAILLVFHHLLPLRDVEMCILFLSVSRCKPHWFADYHFEIRLNVKYTGCFREVFVKFDFKAAVLKNAE